jgi:hypothetical protein
MRTQAAGAAGRLRALPRLWILRRSSRTALHRRVRDAGHGVGRGGRRAGDRAALGRDPQGSPGTRSLVPVVLKPLHGQAGAQGLAQRLGKAGSRSAQHRGIQRETRLMGGALYRHGQGVASRTPAPRRTVWLGGNGRESNAASGRAVVAAARRRWQRLALMSQPMWFGLPREPW